MPLPMVKEEICGAMAGEWSRDNFYQFFDAMIERLKKENPVIVKVLEGFGKKLFDQGVVIEPKSIVYAGMMTYRLLESQQELDDLEAQIG
jgi:hypothetical protein